MAEAYVSGVIGLLIAMAARRCVAAQATPRDARPRSRGFDARLVERRPVCGDRNHARRARRRTRSRRSRRQPAGSHAPASSLIGILAPYRRLAYESHASVT